jgi:hypothetical protein
MCETTSELREEANPKKWQMKTVRSVKYNSALKRWRGLPIGTIFACAVIGISWLEYVKDGGFKNT